MQFSTFGTKFSQHSGITQLMDDLNDGLRNPDAIMLGGGNPAAIPEMIEHFEQLSQKMLEDGSLVAALSNYDGPQGKTEFIAALAELLNKTFGWQISSKNIMLTNGSQCAFFYLFNLFGGKYDDGSFKKILLPLTPEYIGYADAGLDPDIFTSLKPTIEYLDNRQFKYHVDFSALEIDDSISAICASRPTNPTGNVLTDEEIEELDKLARKHNIPLIIDNAYGVPFPNIIFEDVKPFWNDNTILCSSLSKLGLPGVRCGIIIANEETITALTNINGIVSLSPCGVGPALALEMIKSGDLLRLSKDVIKPFYHAKALRSIELLQQAIPDPRFKIHKPEGAIFLWLWFEGLPITTKELYRRLKERGLLIVPGEYFFIGSEMDWSHTHECLRMNYVQDDEKIQRGVEILKEEIEKAYSES
ncbi:valine--pyruvate transaminase [Enterovibrio norvegicus FF-454]|uniref:Valine--pyruvate transaminase n=1 Tax=Enterovibrio norvegicus FF-454 TaxID=1185651 RepID=A0A1E5C1N6_9GAMM|nr:valine--pyruvate transaminase [Enterovibrio norvegicus]OEE59399.1 valine--pyruvate transaminase [Enterovibrio norvegicus FF-454]